MFYFLFYFQDVAGLWAKFADQGIAIVVLLVIGIFGLLFFTKGLPVWKEVRMADATARETQAKALGELALSQTQLANVVKDVAVEQRRATDSVMILQRVNANESQNITASVDLLVERMDTLEEAFKEQSSASQSKTAKKN
jgi:hypothetical protein